MLAYFLLCGEDPRPNQHKFPNFAESIQENIKRRFAPRWTSIPRYISETVKGCTQDKQADRIPFSVAMESFRTAHRMVSLNELDADHPVLLLEIASGVDPVESEFEVHEFGRHIVATSHDRSKKIELRLSNDKERLCVDVVLSKVRSEHDHRNVMKYLPAAKDKVVSKLKSAGLKDVYGEIGLGRLDIHARAPLRSSVSISQIQALAKALVGARIEMELS
jgi:hypothetical protein